MIVQVPKIKDFEKVNQLAKQVHELHVKWRPDLFLPVEEVICKKDFEKMIQDEAIFVAKWQEGIVGYVTVAIQEKNHYGMRYRKQIEIEAICVDENCQGKGIGTALLNYVKEFSKNQGCTDLYLTVNQENEKAIRVYESLGMKVKNVAYSMEI